MRRLLIALSLLAALLTPGLTAAQDVTPPDQPPGGPGGRVYRFDESRGEHHGEKPTGYWLFEPVGDSGDAPPLPVVIFLHGYTATDPAHNGAWIAHIVRQGRVVVFPDYQTDDLLGDSPLEYTGNMIAGVTAALDELATGAHVPTEVDTLTVVGHSMGGVLALNYAALAPGLGLPVPVALMAVTPGGCSDCGGPGDDGFGVPYRDLSLIDPVTKLLMVVGEDDDFVGQTPARRAWGMTDQIPDANRDYLVARSDRHGEPALVADHIFPETSGATAETDALDWYGTWKWLDGLYGCAVGAPICAVTMNGGATELDMGAWSDGEPVNPPLLVADP